MIFFCFFGPQISGFPGLQISKNSNVISMICMGRHASSWGAFSARASSHAQHLLGVPDKCLRCSPTRLPCGFFTVQKRYLFPHPGWIAARAHTGWIGPVGPRPKKDKKSIFDFVVHGKNRPGWTQIGPGGFFPTNPDLADILGRTDLNFKYFFLFFGAPNVWMSRSPKSGFPDFPKSGFPGPKKSGYLRCIPSPMRRKVRIW